MEGAQGNHEVKVIQDSNDDAALARRMLEDKQLELKANTDCLVKEHRKVQLGIKVGVDIMVTGVPGQEVNVAEKKKVKESMEANLHWVTKGLLDKAKEIILGMEIFMTQSGNTLRESRFLFFYGMSVHIWGTLYDVVKGWSVGNRDEEKKRKGSCVYVVVSHENKVVCTRPGIACADETDIREKDEKSSKNGQNQARNGKAKVKSKPKSKKDKVNGQNWSQHRRVPD
ncbi:hypothetical protein Tco_0929386, partial [Tanacetum coccineum]